MFATAALVLHAACGGLALLAGPVAMFSRKRRGVHTRSGWLYTMLALATCLSALALVSLEGWTRYWILGAISIATLASVMIGFLAARRKWRNWITAHIVGQLSSYISMVTAFVVVNRSMVREITGLPSLWCWILPTLIGTPLIMLAVSRASRPAGPRGPRTPEQGD